ncbi:hypothetical protein SOVF_156730 [Spinacia oleracea]|uniref:F-box/FBD/LRR-repeat protein At1g13570 n=1 Tax=Spinacia oleracea TaxID=3562 RepID=A0A9R0K2F5_SPIOL|nr:F-box/FBD/LRR-repeat protein At1g13570-like [Spinacia oleracea]KNA08993.1 hypothetical protein SOVF_156730 [Spinacia oleracea]
MANMICLSSLGEQDPSELTVDRISGLPWIILDIILGKLSINDAARTSILAKDWRYKWLSISKFVLNTEGLNWDTVSSIINRFLLQHTCSIKIFSLRTVSGAFHYPDLYHWIKYLSRQHVEEISLTEVGIRRFAIPSSMFSFVKLKSLILKGCAVRVPASFKRFNFLCEITLDSVSIDENSFDRLILGCPRLRLLHLERVVGIQHLRIRSPSLRVLNVDSGFYQYIVIEDSPCLATIAIEASFLHQEGAILNWSIIRSLSALNSLRNLCLSGQFVKLLAAYNVVEYIPLRNNTMRHLFLYSVRFEDIKVFRVCLSLLSSSPNINHFRFAIESAKGPRLITAFLKENRGRFSFPKLESMKVGCPVVNGMGCTVNFIEFLCAHSPNLKFLSIEKIGGRTMNVTRVSKMLSRFRKSCPRATVVYSFNGRQSSL